MSKVKHYRSEPYWEKEQPEEIKTDKLWLSHYSQAGKLQISQTYKDRVTGEPARGKTITIDAEDIQLNPAAGALIIKALTEWISLTGKCE